MPTSRSRATTTASTTRRPKLFCRRRNRHGMIGSSLIARRAGCLAVRLGLCNHSLDLTRCGWHPHPLPQLRRLPEGVTPKPLFPHHHPRLPPARTPLHPLHCESVRAFCPSLSPTKTSAHPRKENSWGLLIYPIAKRTCVHVRRRGSWGW
jgi:hypothetical protein